jgi:hypothetical protein
MNDDLLYDDFLMKQLEAIEWRRLCEEVMLHSGCEGFNQVQWMKDANKKYWELLRKYDRPLYDKYHPAPMQ